MTKWSSPNKCWTFVKVSFNSIGTKFSWPADLKFEINLSNKIRWNVGATWSKKGFDFTNSYGFSYQAVRISQPAGRFCSVWNWFLNLTTLIHAVEGTNLHHFIFGWSRGKIMIVHDDTVTNCISITLALVLRLFVATYLA